LRKGLVKPLRAIGERFARHEIFIPDLIVAANVMKAECDIMRAAMAVGH